MAKENIVIEELINSTKIFDSKQILKGEEIFIYEKYLNIKLNNLYFKDSDIAKELGITTIKLNKILRSLKLIPERKRTKRLRYSLVKSKEGLIYELDHYGNYIYDAINKDFIYDERKKKKITLTEKRNQNQKALDQNRNQNQKALDQKALDLNLNLPNLQNLNLPNLNRNTLDQNQNQNQNQNTLDLNNKSSRLEQIKKRRKDKKENIKGGEIIYKDKDQSTDDQSCEEAEEQDKIDMIKILYN